MSSGPIEFLNDVPVSEDQKPDTQFGGRAGLIQPERVNEAEAHSELTEEEKRGIAHRYGMRPLTSHEAWTGEVESQDIVDPVTGRVLDPADLEDVTGDGGTPSDLKPA